MRGSYLQIRRRFTAPLPAVGRGSANGSVGSAVVAQVALPKKHSIYAALQGFFLHGSAGSAFLITPYKFLQPPFT